MGEILYQHNDDNSHIYFIMHGEFKLLIDLNTYVYDMDVLNDLTFLDNHDENILVDSLPIGKNIQIHDDMY